MDRRRTEREVDVLAQLRDELEVQAWLARAEWSHPSLRRAETRREVDLLAGLRDELRVQLHLGQLEAGGAFEALEERWRRLKEAAALAAGDEEDVHGLLREIREGYRRMLGDDRA